MLVVNSVDGYGWRMCVVNVFMVVGGSTSYDEGVIDSRD